VDSSQPEIGSRYFREGIVLVPFVKEVTAAAETEPDALPVPDLPACVTRVRQDRRDRAHRPPCTGAVRISRWIMC
jgi:hypothetical protein